MVLLAALHCIVHFPSCMLFGLIILTGWEMVIIYIMDTVDYV